MSIDILTVGSNVVAGRRYWYYLTIGGVTQRYEVEALVNHVYSTFDLMKFENHTPKIWSMTQSEADSLNPQIMQYDSLLINGTHYRNEMPGFANPLMTNTTLKCLPKNISLRGDRSNVQFTVDLYDRYSVLDEMRKRAYSVPSGKTVMAEVTKINIGTIRLKVTIKQPPTKLYTSSYAQHIVSIDGGLYTIQSSNADTINGNVHNWNITGNVNDYFIFKIVRNRQTNQLTITKGNVNTNI